MLRRLICPSYLFFLGFASKSYRRGRLGRSTPTKFKTLGSSGRHTQISFLVRESASASAQIFFRQYASKSDNGCKNKEELSSRDFPISSGFTDTENTLTAASLREEGVPTATLLTQPEKFYSDAYALKSIILSAFGEENKNKRSATGIYKFTNKLNGNFYIGSSFRSMPHSSPRFKLLNSCLRRSLAVLLRKGKKAQFYRWYNNSGIESSATRLNNNKILINLALRPPVGLEPAGEFAVGEKKTPTVLI